MQKQRIILIVGIILGLIAVFMTKVYIDQQRQNIKESAKKEVESIKSELQTSQASVLVAKQDIPRGSVINPESLEISIVPNQFVQPQAVTSLDRIAGMLTLAPISKGEQITLSKLAQSRQAGGLAEITPVGKRAITISVDDISSLAGMIKAGDYVDVIAMLAVPVQAAGGQQTVQGAVVPLFQNVLILAVGQDIGAPVLASADSRYQTQERRGGSSGLITIALTPQEANLIAFVQEQQGKVRLVLRSPADSQLQPVQATSWDTLFQYLMPQGAQNATGAEVKPAEAVSYVEIYRGTNKEMVPLSK